MSEEPELEEKIRRELFESDKQGRYLRRRSEEYKTLEAVFDRSTLFTLYDMMNRGQFSYLNGVVKAGKEGRVYWGIRGKEDVAVKIFYTVTSNFKRRMPYMAGDPRFRHVRKYGRGLILEWAKKEFANLKQAFEAGVNVPEPFALSKNVIVMQFIGEQGTPAPTLAETRVTRRDYSSVMKNVRLLYQKARLVHADLSEFNVFKFRGKVYLFDFGSAVDLGHPLSGAFFRRDVNNINRFFTKRGIEVTPEGMILKRVGVE